MHAALVAVAVLIAAEAVALASILLRQARLNALIAALRDESPHA